MRTAAERRSASPLQGESPNKIFLRNYCVEYFRKEMPDKKMVGTTGFEPATSPTPRVRDTRLRYVPTGVRHAFRVTRP